jgi:hypothetical protein
LQLPGARLLLLVIMAAADIIVVIICMNIISKVNTGTGIHLQRTHAPTKS